MKPIGRHPQRKLTAVKVKSICKQGRYADGNGLYLIVDPTGAKRWMLRTIAKGRRRDIGLGGVQTVSLAEARDKAAELRKIARAGGDPLAEKRTRTAVPTFAQAGQLVHKEHLATWKNKKHAAQWINTLSKYAFDHRMTVVHFGFATPLTSSRRVARSSAPIPITHQSEQGT